MNRAALSNSYRASSEIITLIDYIIIEAPLQPFTALSNVNTCKCNDAPSITNGMHVCTVFTRSDAALN